MRLFTSAYNEMYVKDISAKIRRTLAYKREQGQFIASFAPYGYMIDAEDKHHLVIDEKTAPVVRQIFDMYISGAGYRAIVLKLNSDGIVSPTEYKRQKGSKYVNLNADTSNSRGLWTQSTVARILANEMYTGTLVQGKSHHISYKNKKRKKVDESEWIRIPNTHEAIIDAETWARTQARLRSNGRVGKRSQELSPLSGKVKCAVCGRPMKRNVYYNKAKTIKYYGLQCAAYKTGAMNCTNKKSISGLVLEKKAQFIDARKHIRFKELTNDEKNDLIDKDATFGRVVCRCETITEGEIIAALRSPIPPVSLDGIKRRAGTGMGRCQGGFCGPKVLEIMADYKDITFEDILQDDTGSYILTGETKTGRD